MSDFADAWMEPKLAELRYLRACIHAWAGGDMPGTEAMQKFRELAAQLMAQQAGYAQWRALPIPRPSQVFHWPWPPVSD